MFFFRLSIYFCFVSGISHIFPLRTCNHGCKALLFIMDCQGELLEQKMFRLDAIEYLMHETNNIIDVDADHTCVINGTEFENKDICYKFICNTTIPISNVMEISREWQEVHSILYDERCMHLSIVFLRNINDSNSLQEYISKKVTEEKSLGQETNRFFIIQSSENANSSVDFFYHVKSFKDLKMSVIFFRICDMSQTDLSISYLNNYFKNSTYYIRNAVSEMSNIETDNYCLEQHGSELPSIETLDEALYIFQFIKNMSIAGDTKSINLHLGLKNPKSMPGFFWESKRFFWHFNNFNYSDFTSCFYINLSYMAQSNQMIKNIAHDFGKHIQSIKCEEKLQQTLVLCEYNDYKMLDVQTSARRENMLRYLEKLKLNTDKFVLDRISFLEFMSWVLHSGQYSDVHVFFEGDSVSVRMCQDPIKICLVYDLKECIFDDEYSEGSLESYACNDDFTAKSDNQTKDKNRSIFVESNENEPIFKFNTIDLSQSTSYNLCKNKTTKVHANTRFNLAFLEKSNNQFCNGTCSNQVVNFNFSIEHFQCKTDPKQYFYKCIKDIRGQCQDNSNLQNCENFTCPQPFFKCPNSYCTLPFPNGQFDCPNGEDEILKFSKLHGLLLFSFVLKDMCINSVSFDTLSQLYNQSGFICDNACPKNYRCISSRIEIKDDTSSSKRSLKLYHSAVWLVKQFDTLFPSVLVYRYFNLFSVVLFQPRNCHITDFDGDFRFWDLSELLMLDLSGNNLTHSDKLKSIEHFTKLKKLNLSNNVDLVMSASFSFPSSLEIIDLCHTKVRVLRGNVFINLIYLRYLNLSYTSITRFKDMGIPQYFTLNTLHIEGIRIRNIGIDLFKGLTIRSGVWANDYIICCPLILNANISADKCHAPFDIISSCKHLVGDTIKRIVIWIVGLLTIVGNGIVLVYRIGWNRDIFKKAYGHFKTGLAVSDFMMGMYLVIIAGVDVYYKDVYMLEDFQWRNSLVCRFTGFLSTLSSETSTFFICLITMDRFLNITFPFGNHSISPTRTAILIAVVWILGLVLALVPVFLLDWEIYSSNGLCLALPFSSKQNKGWLFSFIVFVVLNFVLFLLIAIFQVIIFVNIIRIKNVMRRSCKNNQSRSNDFTVATKLAMVALTDFCCWFPIGILGFYSLKGYVFDREVYAWVAVFVLPINSALNPIVYTIPVLLSKCKKYVVGDTNMFYSARQ